MTSSVDSSGLLLPDHVVAREAYLSARPWPHLVLHDVVDPDLVRAAEREATAPLSERLVSVPTRRQRKEETGEQACLGPAMTRLLALLEGDAWRAFCEHVTGVPRLLGDPERFGAGLHRTPQGGFTMAHTDFTHQPTTGLHHRVNTLLYLNADWQPAWGGCLELWPSDMSARGAVIVPEAGTLVLWETHAGTVHGLPDPVCAPDGRSRHALAVYHYTREPGVGLPRQRIATYRRRPQDPWWLGMPDRHDLRRWARSAGRRGAPRL